MYKKLIYILLGLPILAMLTPMLLSGDTLFAGDFDMQIQMTEAARLSIVKFHQFPFWNPWIVGGVPLFADPQFGLFTPQTILSLLVGSIYAWKLSILVYFLIGFYGMHALLRYVTKYNSSVYSFIIISSISYIWIFGSFFSLRSIGGHFTFMILSLLPLTVLFLYKSLDRIVYAAALTILIAYSINAALHYSTILIILVLLFISLIQSIINILSTIKSKSNHYTSAVKPMIVVISSIILAVLINWYRVYLSLEYLKDNSVDRSSAYEPFIGMKEGFLSIAKPYGSYVSNPNMAFNQFESSNYIGELTSLLFLILSLMFLYLIFKDRKAMKISFDKLITFLLLMVGTFMVGVGGILFYAIRLFPILSSMRVSTRYFFVTTFSMLVVLAIITIAISRRYYKHKIFTVSITILFMLSAVQVYYNSNKFQNRAWHSGGLITIETDDIVNQPKGEKYWNTDLNKHYFALTESTNYDKSQLIADNALVDTRAIETVRCDEDDTGCSFVLSNNAEIVYWSPNKLILHRTNPGAIELNMNPGSHWKVNNDYVFGDLKIIDTTKEFIINDNSDIIILEYKPIPSLVKKLL